MMQHAHSTQESAGDELIALLRRQLEMYQELQLLAKQQRSLIQHEDTRPLLSVLARRQLLVETMMGVSDRLGPLQVYFKGNPSRLSADQRQSIERLLEDTKQALRDIIQLDEEDGRMLSARKACKAQEIEHTLSTQQAYRAYGLEGSREPRQSLRTDESA